MSNHRYRQALLSFMLGMIALAEVQAAELPFALAKAHYQPLLQEQILDGVVEAVNRSTVSAQTSGRVKEILVDVNDYVEQGATIIRLEDIEQRARLKQAEAQLSEARAHYQEAQAEYERVKNIYAKKLVSKSEMDTVTAALRAAEARLEVARSGVVQAKEELDYTVIKAPYAGIVLERHVELGEAVQPGQPLMTGFSLEQLRVVANVPQRLIDQVRQHSQARVILPDEQQNVAAERLTFFPYADPESNVFKVRVYLPKNTRKLYPGMFVKTAFAIGETKQLIIPKQAVVYRSEVTGVYVVKDHRVDLRQIRVGRTVEDNMIEVLAGLDAGEQVALDPIAAGVYLKERRTES